MKSTIKTTINKKAIKKVVKNLENELNKEFNSNINKENYNMKSSTLETLVILKENYIEGKTTLELNYDIFEKRIPNYVESQSSVYNDLYNNDFITNKTTCMNGGILIFNLSPKGIKYMKGKIDLENNEKQNIQQINNFYGNYNQAGNYCSMEIHNNDDAINVIDKMLLLTKENNDIHQKIKELKEVAKKDNKVKALEIITNIVSIIIAIPTLYNMLNPYITLLIQFFNA